MTARNPGYEPDSATSFSAEAAPLEAEHLERQNSGNPFAAAVRATRMPMVVTDPRLPDNPIVFVNAAFVQLTGYTREDCVGRNCRFLQGPQTNRDDVRAIAAAVAAQRTLELELLNYRKDGTTFWNRLLLAPVHDATGVLTYFFASQLDVTLARERVAELEQANLALAAARLESERRLAFHEESYRLAVEAAEVGTWDLDLTTDVLTWSTRTKSMFGIGPDAPCSMADFYGGLHPDDREATTLAFASALDPARRETYDVEYRTIGRDDGLIRWVAAKGKGLFDADGRCIRALGTAIDVTGRKRIEERLRQRESSLRELNATLEVRVAERTAERDRMWRLSADLMLVTHTDHTILSVNPAWSRVLGWSESELVGHAFEEFLHPDDLASTEAEAERLVAGAQTFSFENRYRSKPGGYRWISWAATAENGRLHCVGRDVTEEKNSSEALRQAQKMEAVGQLTGGIAHDFNNLLTVIRSAADFLRRRDLKEESRQRYVNAISETADRGAKLTAQLLAFARRQPLAPEVFAAGERVDGVGEMIRSLVGARVAVAIDLGSRPLYVRADRVQFETAIVNLAVNARDAMQGEGRLHLVVEAVDAIPPVRRHPERKGAYVAVSVVDTGPGISTEDLPRIFEPFFTTKPVGQGTGLGLSQVFGFAKQSGGDVAVTTREREGATFTIYLHEAPPPPAAEAPIERAREPAAPVYGSCILVVEDNVAVGEFSTQLLRDLGYRTTWASDAGQALAALARDDLNFDAVFTDVIMPGMTGVELGHEIRRLYPGLPVILTSGYSHVLAEQGRHGFELLQKPYSVEAMSRVLRRAVRDRPR